MTTTVNKLMQTFHRTFMGVVASASHSQQGPAEGQCEPGETALGPLSIPSPEVSAPPVTYLPAPQCLKVAPQLLHSDRDVLHQLRSTWSLLVEHICPPAVWWHLLQGNPIWYQGWWEWRVLKHQAWSCSIGRLPSLLEELHGALLQGQVCQLQHALPMQHVPEVRGRWIVRPTRSGSGALGGCRTGNTVPAQPGGWDRCHFPVKDVRSSKIRSSRVSERAQCVHTRGICKLQSELKVLFRHFILKFDSRISVYYEWKSSKHAISENSKQSGVNEWVPGNQCVLHERCCDRWLLISLRPDTAVCVVGWVIAF